uniref:Transmembrane protein n=1 Tax=Schistosoma curassoni TaxID=6186 RepID=A0A183L1Z3_9TREM
MFEHRLSQRAMLTGVRDDWKKVRVGQTKTWHQCLKTLTPSLCHVGRSRLLGWGPRDYRDQWLKTLGNMAQNRPQWCRCINSLSSLILRDLNCFIFFFLRTISFFLYYILIAIFLLYITTIDLTTPINPVFILLCLCCMATWTDSYMCLVLRCSD